MKCRHCKSLAKSSNFNGEGVESNFLYKCQVIKCGVFFWHRRVLREFDLNDPSAIVNEQREQKVCDDLSIPLNLRERFVYVIKLHRDEGEVTDTVYVGETGHHPLRRYLQHLRGYKSGKNHVKKRGKYLLSFEEGFKTVKQSQDRERALAHQLSNKFLVVGGH